MQASLCVRDYFPLRALFMHVEQRGRMKVKPFCSRHQPFNRILHPDICFMTELVCSVTLMHLLNEPCLCLYACPLTIPLYCWCP